MVINGRVAGSHQGGYTSFALDITDFVQEGENVLFVGVQDDTRSSLQPTGKQAVTYESKGCWYTRTTGIWQTVWLEFVPQAHICMAKYYPDGIYTAGTDEELVRDIEISFAAGFNGARLHEKVFEPRFLYHCDRLGYPVWAEFPNWGLDYAEPQATEVFVHEWSEAIERDFNHPAIIGWCPFNETWGYFEAEEKNSLVSSVYHLTKRLDATRPCIDCSGPHGVCSEVYDIHDYEQNESVFKKLWDDFTSLIQEKGVGDPSIAAFINERPFIIRDGAAPFYGKPYDGQPIFISEYGGIRWPDDDGDGWGYGNAPKTGEEFFTRYQGLTEAMLFNSEICGFCYTQLYDIEQEVNGFYTYNRRPKFDMNIVKKINEQKAAIEK